MTLPRWSQVAAYAASKLTAAGLVFLAFLVIVGGFRLYEMSEITRQMPLWGSIYGYAVLFSALADAVLCKCKAGPAKKALTVLLYMLGGYVPFWFWFPGQWVLSLIAGLYGIICALAFLAATQLFRSRWPYSATAALLLLAVALYISLTDFTVTKQWTETRTADGYQAEFAYFHGHKEIPVKLEAGQTLSYYMNWQVTDGGYGTHLDAKGGTYENVTRGGEPQIAYRVNAPSTVRIVITGDQARGALTVVWEITGSDYHLQNDDR
ncbi:hypothetical protein BK133_30535 [Paenibacillus sp. FSL H8-0548]|uniref:hypothetical protein n=1 Tax=Paenibacillus sp. FSL H8-0548 TaxID=1920422 RepID=UPI00096EBACF|nr:hypothetical protein [Paenibacillus sp. FSL H8-0548]OMF18511.1 hypothetical protein BK133_30535 [Paenibacillus sp. FSL H8-0548]